MALPLLEKKEGSKGPRTMVTELAIAFYLLWARAAFYIMLLGHLIGLHPFGHIALNAPHQAWAALQGYRAQMWLLPRPVHATDPRASHRLLLAQPTPITKKKLWASSRFLSSSVESENVSTKRDPK